MSVGKFNIQKKSEMHTFLRKNGYERLRTTKHEIWGREDHRVSLPTGKGRKINPMVANRLIKEVNEKWGGGENEV
jgi:hypothetical protein